MEKIGILGGTFDPVHFGHLYLAEQARDEAGLSKVVFMPAKLQPFKLDKKVADGKHRLAMIRLAISGLSGLEVSEFELLREEISYTIHTLRAVREKAKKGSEIYFIIGTDAFLKMNMWRESEELLTEYSYIVGARPGYRQEELSSCIEYNKEVYNTNICRIHNRQVPISSTEIKEKVRMGQSLCGLVPKAVERYIYDKGLYQ